MTVDMPMAVVQVGIMRVLVHQRQVAVRVGVRLARRPRGRGKVANGRAPLENLAAGTVLRGPLMLDGGDATGRLEAGWRGVVHESGAVLVERVS